MGFAGWGSYETLQVERDAGAVRITFDRPASLNAFNPDMARELVDALTAVGQDADARAVLLRGSGKGFSSGGDLAATTDLDTPTLMRTVFNPVVLAVRALPKPVVAAVHGPGVGFGCSVAMACDVVLMARSAYFLLAFTKVGLVPDGGASLLAARRAGGGKAMGMALLADRVGAQDALAHGLATRLCDDLALADEADALVRELAAGPTVAFEHTKRLLDRAVFSGLAEELELEAELQGACTATQDFVEAQQAFVQKRKPVFAGR